MEEAVHSPTHWCSSDWNCSLWSSSINLVFLLLFCLKNVQKIQIFVELNSFDYFWVHLFIPVYFVTDISGAFNSCSQTNGYFSWIILYNKDMNLLWCRMSILMIQLKWFRFRFIFLLLFMFSFVKAMISILTFWYRILLRCIVSMFCCCFFLFCTRY